jgi:hypothetical protein
MLRPVLSFVRALAFGAFGAFVVSMPLAVAHQPASAAHAQFVRVPAALMVDKQLGAPPAGVAELKFRDLFKLPVGARGLEATDQLKSLDGKRVRIVGYMVNQEPVITGGFLLSPLPVAAGDEDESLADDIPASAIYVSLQKAGDAIIPTLPGLIQLTGTLRVGAYEIPVGERIVPARIELDVTPERALLRLARKPRRIAKAR